MGQNLLIAPIPGAIFLECVCPRRFSSLNIPSDFTEETCFIGYVWLCRVTKKVDRKVDITLDKTVARHKSQHKPRQKRRSKTRQKKLDKSLTKKSTRHLETLRYLV